MFRLSLAVLFAATFPFASFTKAERAPINIQEQLEEAANFAGVPLLPVKPDWEKEFDDFKNEMEDEYDMNNDLDDLLEYYKWLEDMLRYLDNPPV